MLARPASSLLPERWPADRKTLLYEAFVREVFQHRCDRRASREGRREATSRKVLTGHFHWIRAPQVLRQRRQAPIGNSPVQTPPTHAADLQRRPRSNSFLLDRVRLTASVRVAHR